MTGSISLPIESDRHMKLKIQANLESEIWAGFTWPPILLRRTIPFGPSPTLQKVGVIVAYAVTPSFWSVGNISTIIRGSIFMWLSLAIERRFQRIKACFVCVLYAKVIRVRVLLVNDDPNFIVWCEDDEHSPNRWALLLQCFRVLVFVLALIVLSVGNYDF